MVVGRLFLAVQQGCLRFVFVVFSDHTHLLFLTVLSVGLPPREKIGHKTEVVVDGSFTLLLRFYLNSLPIDGLRSKFVNDSHFIT